MSAAPTTSVDGGLPRAARNIQKVWASERGAQSRAFRFSAGWPLFYAARLARADFLDLSDRRGGAPRGPHGGGP